MYWLNFGIRTAAHKIFTKDIIVKVDGIDTSTLEGGSNFGLNFIKRGLMRPILNMIISNDI